MGFRSKITMTIEFEAPGQQDASIQFDKFFKKKSKLVNLLNTNILSVDVSKTAVKHDERTRDLNILRGIVKEIIGDVECSMRGHKRECVDLDDKRYDSLVIRVDKDRNIALFHLIPAKEVLVVKMINDFYESGAKTMTFRLADPQLYDQVRAFVVWT